MNLASLDARFGAVEAVLAIRCFGRRGKTNCEVYGTDDASKELQNDSDQARRFIQLHPLMICVALL